MLLNQEEFRKLSEYTDKPAISIFIPTSRAGKEVHNEKNKTQLKSQWDQVKREDGIENFSDGQIDTFNGKINNLLEDKDFWHHQADGLAIFLGIDFFEYYRLPISFEINHLISNSFYIKPLVPMFSPESPFYLLTLELEDVHFYEANAYSIREIQIDDLAPSRIEDRVGYDYKEKTLQSKRMKGGQGGTQFHGHGGAEREDKAEIKNYLSAVDKGLQTFLHDKTAPLVVMGEENLIPIYRETNSYAHLYEKTIAENPADMKMLEIHEEAAKVMEDYFKQAKRDKKKAYNESGLETKSAVVRDIVPAAFAGRIDTLFLENNEDVWGRYDEEKMTVEIYDYKKEDSISLMNLTAKEVLKNDGNVFLLKHAFMPEKESNMNAVFRY